MKRQLMFLLTRRDGLGQNHPGRSPEAHLLYQVVSLTFTFRFKVIAFIAAVLEKTGHESDLDNTKLDCIKKVRLTLGVREFTSKFKDESV